MNQFRILLSCVTLLTLVPIFAQENFEAAIIYLDENQRINGEIDYRGWDKNPSSIRFRNGQDGSINEYQPSDIFGFEFNGKRYVAASVEIEISPTSLNDLDESSEFNLINKQVFLEVLFSGNKDLYFLRTTEDKEQLYIKIENEISLLKYKRYAKKNVEGVKTIAENKAYRSLLAFYLQDCPETSKYLESTDYGLKSIRSLFSNYFSCTATTSPYIQPIEKMELKFGIQAGISLTTLSFTSSAPQSDFLEGTDFTTSIAPTAGIFLDLVLPNTNKKISIVNDFQYTQYSVSGDYAAVLDADRSVKTSTDFGYGHIKLYNAFKYRYYLQHINLFASVGLSNGLVVSEKNYVWRESTNLGIPRVTTEKALSSTTKIEQGIFLGFGAQVGKFGLETRFERANGMSEFVALGSRTNRLFGLISYQF